MKYKSELIHDILEQRGHEFPNLHYQSECVEAWIEEAKGAYPKLCDYESEWLNYIVENPIGEFPYETVTTNSTATINNVVPLAYKSAILSGQTLVNLGVNTNGKLLTPTDINYDVTCSYLEVGKTYYVIVKTNSTSETGVRCGFVNDAGTSWDDTKNYVNYSNNKLVAKKHTLVKTKDSKFRIQLKGTDSNTPSEVNNLIEYVLILEYQQGMENWDIPYFTDMQSVKMPVLTTTGKNLFSGELKVQDGYTGTYSFENNVLTLNDNVGYYYDYILQKDESYFISWDETSENVINIRLYSLNGWSGEDVIQHITNKSVFTPKEDCRLRIWGIQNARVIVKNLLIAKSNTAIPYEPYKSNILTVNEEVELRGIDDVQDTLDCLTGEVTERIGEYIIDGNENWAIYELYNVEGYKSFITTITGLNNLYAGAKTFISGDIKTGSWSSYMAQTAEEMVWNHDPNKIGIKVKNETASNVEELKTFLASNPITVQYELETPIVKTVELTLVNQDGEALSKIKPIEGTMHVEVSGTPLNPTAVLEVPVEAITQNLNSFIEEG